MAPGTAASAPRYHARPILQSAEPFDHPCQAPHVAVTNTQCAQLLRRSASSLDSAIYEYEICCDPEEVKPQFLRRARVPQLFPEFHKTRYLAIPLVSRFQLSSSRMWTFAHSLS